MKKIDAVFVAGPQGSGKGTQGKLLAEKIGFLFWDTGSILREMCKEKDELAKQLAAIDRGTLLPDEVIVEILKERLALMPQGQGVVFDGVPRRIGQAEFLVDFLHAHGHNHLTTVFLDVPREISIERMLLRAKKEGRTDDTPEAIETRFRFYDEVMAPVIAYLKKETDFVRVDGSLPVAAVTKSMYNALGIS